LKSELRTANKFDALKPTETATLNRFENLLVKTIELIRQDQNLQSNEKFETAIEDLQTQWRLHNWEMISSPNSSVFVIREKKGNLTGRGIYAFRTKPQSAFVLQAPHRFNDRLTGSIAMKLFLENSISAIALNTIHRNEIDLAHTKLHYINAFTAAVLKTNHQTSILQLHGFTNKGKTGAAKFAHLIISDTTKFPGRSARQTAIELKSTFDADLTRLFPIEIQQLGGTTNRQAQLAQAFGSPNFLHLEANFEFRSRLNNDASTRDAFFASIVRGFAP
jgi:hypothetical protein